jgi:hypothetical protein
MASKDATLFECGRFAGNLTETLLLPDHQVLLLHFVLLHTAAFLHNCAELAIVCSCILLKSIC